MDRPAEKQSETPRVYIAVAAATLLLLAIAVVVSRLKLGFWGQVIEYAVTAAEALLMAVFYMSLRIGSPLARLFAAAGLFWLTILIGLTLADYLTRA